MVPKKSIVYLINAEILKPIIASFEVRSFLKFSISPLIIEWTSVINKNINANGLPKDPDATSTPFKALSFFLSFWIDGSIDVIPKNATLKTSCKL